MRGNEFADLKAFCAVADELSFARAAARLGVTAPALSQTIRGLEERLGVQLFNRTTRSVSITDAGSLLFARVAPLFEAFDMALEDVSSFRDSPSGKLRINTPRIAVQHILAPHLTAFLRAYPDIELELTVDDRIADIVSGRFDAGIRLGELLEKDMSAAKLTDELSMAVVASPEYFEAYGVPETPHDLPNHRCLRFRWPSAGSIYRWEFEGPDSEFEVVTEGPFITNDTEVMIRAALDGAGLAYLLDAEVREHLDSGALQRVLQPWSPSLPGFYLYHSSRRQTPPPLRAFIDFLRRRLRG